MKSVAVLAALAVPAAAFAPSPPAALRTALNSDAVADEAAAPAPAAPAAFCNGLVGGEGAEPIPWRWDGVRSSKDFDPVGFTERAPEWIGWFREAELKHGRIAMLAALGFVVPEFVRVPGEQFSFEAIPQVIGAHDALIDTSMKQILIWISLAEAMTLAAISNMAGFDREPGDYGFDPLGLFPTTKEAQDEMRVKELKNGRLAMIAVGGMVAGAQISGHGFPYV